MTQRLPFPILILLGAVIAIGVLFYQVIEPFLFSLLFAAVLAVLFRPAQGMMIEICRGRRRIAAGVSTALILVLILLPIGGALILAGSQLVELGQDTVEWLETPDQSWIGQRLDQLRDSEIFGWFMKRKEALSAQQQDQLTKFLSNAADAITKETYDKTQAFIADIVSFVVGFVVMALALYYFFADGEQILEQVKELSPLESADEDLLFEQFGKICRGVVMGTVVSAIAQGFLAGIGFAIVGIDWLWLAAALTVFFSFIPFLGAAAVWIVVAGTLILEQRYGAAIFLGIYGAIIVSGSDNVIKAYIIGGESQLHPLVVLITVLGALQLIGLWGIFVGPMIAAFFYALLKILRKRLFNGKIANSTRGVTSGDSVDRP